MIRARIGLVAGLALLALCTLPTSAASAHAVFVSATPPPGATLPTPPASVRIVFSEPLDAALSGIAVYTSTGRPVRLRGTGVEPGDPRAFDVGLPQLRPGRYTVLWHTVSAIDGHTRRGSYSFTVDRPDGSAPAPGAVAAPPARGPPSVPAWLQAAALWLGLVGLFGLTGSVLTVLLGAGTGLTGLARTRRWLLLAGTGCLAAGTLGQLGAAWAAVGWGGTSLVSLLSSSAGRWWAGRLLPAAVVVAAGRILGRRRAGGPAYRAVGAAAVGVVALTFAATAHGAASPLPTVGLAYEFVHVLAAAVWLGGALAVVMVWAPSRSGGGDRRAFLRRYSLTAGVAVPALLASGLGSALLELGAVGDLVRTAYGRSLLVKLALVLVLTAVAALNALVLRPAWVAGRPRGRHLVRTVSLEAALGLAVLVPTAVLGVLAPSRPADRAHAVAAAIAAQDDPAHAYSGSTRLRGRGAEVTVTPDAVGVNAVRVEVDGNGPAPALWLSLTGPGRPLRTELARTGQDHDTGTHTVYQGTLQLTRSGTWSATLAAAGERASGAALVVPVTAAVAGTAGSAGRDGLTPWLGLIALAGLAAAVAAAGRAVPARRCRAGALALGVTGLAAAVAWAGTLTLGPAGAGGQQAAWGSPRAVRPTSPAGARVWRVPTPGAGLMMPAAAPDGSIWVAGMDGNELARLDPHTNVVQQFRFPGQYRETMGVAVAPDGRVWLAQEHAMALGMFDPAAGRYREFPIPGGDSAPVGVTVAPDGEVWFTEMSGDRIGRFDPGTLRFTAYPVPTPDATPYWLALAPDGRVWFTEFGAGKVGVLDPPTGRIREYALPGGPNPPGIAVGADGTVWITSIQGSLFRLTPSSGRIRRTVLPAAGDYGVALAPDGTVWVGRQGGAALYAVDAASGRVRAHRLAPGSAPWWPVVDRRGHVWVALASDTGNGLAELDVPP